jgi:hypothetical protein
LKLRGAASIEIVHWVALFIWTATQPRSAGGLSLRRINAAVERSSIVAATSST